MVKFQNPFIKIPFSLKKKKKNEIEIFYKLKKRRNIVAKILHCSKNIGSTFKTFTRFTFVHKVMNQPH